MDKLTREQIKAIMPYAKDKNIDKYLPHLNDTMMSFSIDTPLRQAHFLAQIAHESGSLQYVREITSGESYKGRGLTQLTGRSNYEKFPQSVPEADIVEHPERLEEPNLACYVAGWFWDQHKLNEVADRDDIVQVTKVINGGKNGLQERMNFLNRAKLVLKIIG